MNDPVGWKNDKARTVHVHEGHHDKFVGSVFLLESSDHHAPTAFAGRADRLGGNGPALITIVQSGFVAVVAVGNDQLLIAHLCPHQVDETGLGNPPDAVQHAILV